MRRFTWILLSQNAQVIGVDATSLTVGFKTAGARDSFLGGGSEEILRQAAIEMIGADWKVETAVDPSADPGAGSAPRVTRPAVQPPPASSPAAGSRSAAPVATSTVGAAPTSPPAWADQEPPADDEDPGPGDQAGPAAQAGSRRPDAIAAARRGITPTRQGDQPPPPGGPDLDADAHRDDPTSDDNGLDGAELLRRELGATVIEDIPHD